MTAPLRVIKLGGSLLDWPELPSRFRDWLKRQSPAVNVVIVGGGSIVDAVRTIDKRQRLPEEVAHWLAVRAMSVTAQLVAHWVPDTALVTRLDALQLEVPSVQVLDVEQFLRDDSSADGLPRGWHVTSDSIAARAARALAADELVLLKSTMPTNQSSREAWCASGLVDEYFRHVSHGRQLRFVNLRDPDFAQAIAR
jgi:aspartokinase-like uncharacterized kinase